MAEGVGQPLAKSGDEVSSWSAKIAVRISWMLTSSVLRQEFDVDM